MRLLVRVGEAEKFPRGYGIAWRQWDSFGCICAPIPLNIILGAVWRFYWFGLAHAGGLLSFHPGRIRWLFWRMKSARNHGYLAGLAEGARRERERIDKAIGWSWDSALAKLRAERSAGGGE